VAQEDMGEDAGEQKGDDEEKNALDWIGQSEESWKRLARYCKCANYEEDCFSSCLQVESVNFVLHFLKT
jgi:hypothetical protein